MRTIQEYDVNGMIWDIFQLPTTNFYLKGLDAYHKKIKRTKEGFIGREIPYEFGDSVYHSDFGVIIPKKITLRIECKGLDVISNMNSMAVKDLIKSFEMIEDVLVLLLEGKGYENPASKYFINVLMRTFKRVNKKQIYVFYSQKEFATFLLGLR